MRVRVRHATVEGGTHDDDGAGDGDGGHGSVGDGVPPVRVVDALVIAVDASLVGAEPQGQDGRGQRRWGEGGGGRDNERVLPTVTNLPFSFVKNHETGFLLLESRRCASHLNCSICLIFTLHAASRTSADHKRRFEVNIKESLSCGVQSKRFR